MTVTIIVAPIASSPGRFMAKLANEGDVLVRSSRTPFLDAARRLLELGYPVDAVLVMRHARSAVESLRAKIGKAAALTVTTAGSGRPIFVARSVAAALPVRSINESRHILAPRTEIRTGEAAATDSLPIAATYGRDGSSSPNSTHAVNTTRATRKGKEDGYANPRPDTQNGETTMTNELVAGGNFLARGRRVGGLARRRGLHRVPTVSRARHEGGQVSLCAVSRQSAGAAPHGRVGSPSAHSWRIGG
jgi:hypothetical protein